VGAFMTEFGAVSNDTINMELLTWQLEAADSAFQSWTYWQFKYFDDITTAGNNAESLYDAQGQLQLNKLATLSRTYAQAIAGFPTKMYFNSKTGAFELTYTYNANATGNTEIYLNEALWYPNGFKVVLAPSNVATWSHPATNRIEVAHPTQTFTKLRITILPKLRYFPQQ